MKELFDFIVGATVSSNNTANVSVEGKVAVLTFEKDGTTKTISFCGNDIGAWLQEVSLIPKEYYSFEEWENAILNNYYTGIFVDSRSFNHNGNMLIFKGSFPDMFNNLSEDKLKNAVEDYILRDRNEEYVMHEEDKDHSDSAEQIGKMYESCCETLKIALGPEAIIRDDFTNDFGSFIATIPATNQFKIPKGFVLENSSAKLTLNLSHKELKDLNEKFIKS